MHILEIKYPFKMLSIHYLMKDYAKLSCSMYESSGSYFMSLDNFFLVFFKSRKSILQMRKNFQILLVIPPGI